MAQELASALERLKSMPSVTEDEDPESWIEHLDLLVERAVLSDYALAVRGIRRLQALSRQFERLPKACYVSEDIQADIQKPFSSSALSDIYRARVGDQEYAFKVLRMHADNQAKALKAFHEEVIIWRHLRHPNIVPFHGVSTQFSLCLVSRWMPNGTIRSFLQTRPDENRLVYILHIMAGLRYIHSIGIVHGDLKSANILVDENHFARLGDFGLATVLYDSVTFSSTAGTPSGTVRWMAPELLRVDHLQRPSNESDIYALGIVFWELFSMKIPYDDIRNDLTVVLAVTQKNMRPPKPVSCQPSTGFNEGMWQVIRQCWDEDPEKRPKIEELSEVVQMLHDARETISAVIGRKDDQDDAALNESFGELFRSLINDNQRRIAFRVALRGLDYEITKGFLDGIHKWVLSQPRDWDSLAISIISLTSLLVSFVSCVKPNFDIPIPIFAKDIRLALEPYTNLTESLQIIRGSHRTLDKNVCVRWLSRQWTREEGDKWSYQQALIWGLLKHQRLQECLGIYSGQGRARPGLVLSPGDAKGTLFSFLYSELYTPLRHCHKILAQIAEGLIYLHSQDLIIGELSINNIYMNDTDDILLAPADVIPFDLLPFKDMEDNLSMTTPKEGLGDPESDLGGRTVIVDDLRWRELMENEAKRFAMLCVCVYTRTSTFQSIWTEKRFSPRPEACLGLSLPTQILEAVKNPKPWTIEELYQFFSTVAPSRHPASPVPPSPLFSIPPTPTTTTLSTVSQAQKETFGQKLTRKLRRMISFDK